MLDLFTVAFPVVGLLFYSNKIAPPDLIATMAAVAGVFFWTIGTGIISLKTTYQYTVYLSSGKGTGGFVGGQLTIALDITQVFVLVAIIGAALGCVMLGVKMLFGAEWERHVLQEKEVLMKDMKSINRSSDSVKVPHETECETSSL